MMATYLAYIALPLGPKPPLAPGDIPAKAPYVRIGQPACERRTGRLVAIRRDPRSRALPVSRDSVCIAAAHQEQEALFL
jgi:hypothetical protein